MNAWLWTGIALAFCAGAWLVVRILMSVVTLD